MLRGPLLLTSVNSYALTFIICTCISVEFNFKLCVWLHFYLMLFTKCSYRWQWSQRFIPGRHHTSAPVGLSSGISVAVERRRGSPPQSGTAWPLAAVVTYPPLSATSIYVCTFIPVSLKFFFFISQPFILGNDSPATCSPSSHYPALCLQLAPLWSKVLLFLSFSINVPCTSLGPCKRWQVFGECDSQHSSGRAAGPSIIRRSNHYRECGQTSWSCCD